MENKKENLILELTFKFALDIIEYTELLENNKKYVIARQLLKCGTSIEANVREAQNSESKVDFIHKIKIAAKEAEETEYWLFLCKHSKTYPFEELLLDKINHINRILTKIISTSKLDSK
jgi:four helix bundle protein